MKKGWVCESLEDVRREVGECLVLMHDGKLMRDPSRRSALVKGLGLLLIRMDVSQEEEDEAASIFESALSEYTMRLAFIEAAERSGVRRGGCPYCGGGNHPEHEHLPGEQAVCGVDGCRCVGGH